MAKFKKQDLLEVLDDYHETLKMVEDKIVDTRRWSVVHSLVFQDGDKFYQTDYSVGSTEQQEEGPWEYEGDEIECQEVYPDTVSITVYKPVK